MGKPSAPAAPDPTLTAQAQTASNVATADNNAALNRVNQYTPYGSSVYSVDGTTADGTPQYSQTTSLSPTQQNLLNMTQQGETTLGQTALGQLGNLQNAYSQPFSFGGPNVQSSLPNAGQIQTAIGNSGQIKTGVGDAGSIQSGLGNYGSAQTGLDTSGLPGMQSSVNNSGPSLTGQVGSGDYSSQIKQAQDAAYNAQTQYLDPQFQQGQQSLDAKLANQGLSTGNTAYDNAQKNYGLQKQSAYQGAQDAAVSAGNQEQNTLYGQALNSANFQNSANAQGYNQGLSSANLANTANQQGYNQALQSGTFANSGQGQNYTQALGAGTFSNTAQGQQYGQNLSNADFSNSAQNQQYGQNLGTAGFSNSAQNQQYGQSLSNANLNNSASAQSLQQGLGLYNQPLNSYNALATGAQVTNPTFGSVPTANQANTDVAGITNSAYQDQLAAYSAQNAGINNLFGLGGTLGGAAITKYSDRRLKREITRVGTTPGGIPTYTFKYNGDDDQEYFGVMADEVSHIDGAVIRGIDGFDRVDYSRVK